MAKPYFAHASAIVEGETEANGFRDPNIGVATRIWHHCHVMAGARIGARCVLGKNVFVARTAVLGQGCKIQNNVSIYDGVILEDFVFCGPSMIFTNLSTPLPRAAISRHSQYQETLVRRNASIGAGAVIVCGRKLGEACFVAAGAVVTRDVPAYALAAGTPARIAGWVCECGERLVFEDGKATCRARYTLDGAEMECGRSYCLVAADRVERT